MRAFNLFGILLFGFCAVPCLAQTVKHTPDSSVVFRLQAENELGQPH